MDLKNVEKEFSIAVLFYYLPALAVFIFLESFAFRHGMPRHLFWLMIALGSMWFFINMLQREASGARLKSLAMSFIVTGFMMAYSLSIWLAMPAAIAAFFLIGWLFKNTSLSLSAKYKFPPMQAKPVSKEKFFEWAEKGRKSGKFFIGERCFQESGPFWVSEKTLASHSQVVGITGCGKTNALMGLAYQGMIRNWTVIYVSAKNPNKDWPLFWYLANRAGRREDALYFDPTDDESDSFNPIEPVGKQGSVLGVPYQIMRAIGREPPASQERDSAFYKGVDYARISDLSAILIALGKSFTLQDCYYFFADEVARDYILRVAEENGVKDISRRMRKMFEAVSGDEYRALQGIVSNLRPWIDEPLSSIVSPAQTTISIPTLLKKGGIAFFTVQTGLLGNQGVALGRQILAQVLAVGSVLGTGHPPVLLILDEFQEYLAPFFSSLISMTRSQNIFTILAHQDLQQLNRVEGTDKKSFGANIGNNTVTKLLFSCMMPEDAEGMAKMLGSKRIIERSRSMAVDGIGSRALRGISEREREEFVIHPNWFKTPKLFLAACMCEADKDVVRTVLFDIDGVKLPAKKKKEPSAGGNPPLNLEALVRGGIREEYQKEKEHKKQEWKKKETQKEDKIFEDLTKT